MISMFPLYFFSIIELKFLEEKIEEYVGAKLTSIIEFLYSKDKYRKIHWSKTHLYDLTRKIYGPMRPGERRSPTNIIFSTLQCGDSEKKKGTGKADHINDRILYKSKFQQHPNK